VPDFTETTPDWTQTKRITNWCLFIDLNRSARARTQVDGNVRAREPKVTGNAGTQERRNASALENEAFVSIIIFVSSLVLVNSTFLSAGR
jgi:hypothetical protein